MPGPSSPAARAASRTQHKPRNWLGRSPASSARPAGGSNGRSPTTATSFAAPSSRRSSNSGRARPGIRAGRPQTNGAVESLHKTILDECWRPAFARYLQVRFHGLRRGLADYLRYYNHERAHTGRLTRGRIPADIV
jgi:hypothetical protein